MGNETMIETTPPPVETPTPEVQEVPTPEIQQKPEEPKPDKLSSRFLALAKREQGIVKRQQEMKAMEQQLAEREARIKKYEEMEKQRPDPLKLLETHGYSYKDATDYVLNDQKPTADIEIKNMKHEFDSYKKSQEQMRAKEIDEMRTRQQEEYDRTIEDFKTQVLDFVSTNADDYELINLYEAGGLVYDTIEAHFNQTKKVLSTKEASDLVEKYLEDQVEKTTKTKKFQSRFLKPDDANKDAKQNASTPVTLTNSMSSSSPSMLPAKTETERLQRAMAALDRK